MSKLDFYVTVGVAVDKRELAIGGNRHDWRHRLSPYLYIVSQGYPHLFQTKNKNGVYGQR
jgi:hypothetical protein